MKKFVLASIVCTIFLFSGLLSFASSPFNSRHGTWTYENEELVSELGNAHYVAEFKNLTELRDFEINFNIQLDSWQGWHGLNFRREDSSLKSLETGYIVKFQHGKPTVDLYENKDGEFTKVATGRELDYGPDMWLLNPTNVKVKVEGSNLTVYVNNMEEPVLIYNNLSIEKGSLAFTTDSTGSDAPEPNSITIKNVDLKINDKEELTLKKLENDYIAEISGWNPYYKYQIWTWEEVDNEFVEAKSNQWVLARQYTAGHEMAALNGKIYANLGTSINKPSSDNFYTVAVKVLDKNGNFVKQYKNTFTPAGINEVVIEKVEVDGKFADDKTIVKEIGSGATVNMEVFTNDVQNITYTATVQPGNIALNSSDNTFDWNISGLAPGSYTVTFEAQNGSSSDTRTVKFNLFSVSTPAGGFASFGTQRPVITGNNNVFTFNANTPAGNPSGMQYRYTLSEPWSTTLKNQSSTSASQTLSLGEEQFGIYHAITRLYRPGSSTVDDGAIVTVNFDRLGIGDLTLNVGHAGGPSNKGTTITIDPSITGGTLPGVQYSFWRRDATGWRRIRDYAEGGITWTPARIGDYTIQVRAKGEGAGSYELVRNIEFNITDATETDTKLTVNGGITLNWSDNPTARRPVTLTANAVNPSSGDVLYKFIISDGYLFYIETSYSPDPTYTFMAGAARNYNVSVLVKNNSSFGKYDAIASFTLPVGE